MKHSRLEMFEAAAEQTESVLNRAESAFDRALDHPVVQAVLVLAAYIGIVVVIGVALRLFQ